MIVIEALLRREGSTGIRNRTLRTQQLGSLSCPGTGRMPGDGAQRRKEENGYYVKGVGRGASGQDLEFGFYLKCNGKSLQYVKLGIKLT